MAAVGNAIADVEKSSDDAPEGGVEIEADGIGAATAAAAATDALVVAAVAMLDAVVA
jgi:hypothetical protein